MSKKLFIIAVAVLVYFGNCGLALAMCGFCEAKAETVVKESEGQTAVDAGNKICPVTGDKINEKSKVTYEYEGKIYNFCCPACIGGFKKEPQKYIDIVGKEQKEETTHKH